MISPFIDPVTKTKMRYNEPLTDHIPGTQLMKAAGGECEFEYVHDVYWPALNALADKRRQEKKERWEKAGKHVGESEIYLWGGEEASIGPGSTKEPEEKNEVDEKKDVDEGATNAETLVATAPDEKAAVDGADATKPAEVVKVAA